MPNYKELFRKASGGLVDGLLLALCAVAEPNKGADIQIVGIVVFLGVFLFGILAVLFATFVAGCIIFCVVTWQGQAFHANRNIAGVFAGIHPDSQKRSPGIS